MKKYLLLPTLLLSFSCSKDPVESAYQACMEKMNSEVGDKMRSDMAKSSDPAGLNGAMVGMAEGLGKGMCEAIRSTCKQDPNGQACQLMIKQLQ